MPTNTVYKFQYGNRSRTSVVKKWVLFDVSNRGTPCYILDLMQHIIHPSTPINLKP